MLAITVFIPILLSVGPVAFASPLASSGGLVLHVDILTVSTTDGQTSTLTTPTTTAGMSTLPPGLEPPSSPRQEGPERTPQARAPQPRDDGGFAVSSTAETASGSASASVATLANTISGEAETQTRARAKAMTTPAAVAVEAPPVDDPEADSELARQGYSQTTYYTCVTYAATSTHCGWHVPVVHGAGAADGPRRGRGEAMAIAAAACGMMANAVLGW